MEVKAQSAADIDCWHCGLKGHYKSDNSKLQLKELDVGIQNLNIDICDKAHSLFSVDKGWTKVQKEKKEKNKPKLTKKTRAKTYKETDTK